MSGFRNILHLCTSKTEKEAVRTDPITPNRPIIPRNKASAQNDLAPKKASFRNVSPESSSSIESASPKGNTSEPKTEHPPLRINKTSTPTNLGGNIKGFGAADPHMTHDKSTELTGMGAAGSHSALFGLISDGHEKNKATYSSSKPEPAHGAEDHTSGDGPAALVTVAPVRVGMSDGDMLEHHGTSTVDDSKVDDELLARRAAANTSIARDGISSRRNSISGEAGTCGCDADGRA
jgi:hypothetical protein